MVEVNYSFPKSGFDRKAERQRTTFNVGLQTLRGGSKDSPTINGTVRSIVDLARHRLPSGDARRRHVEDEWPLSPPRSCRRVGAARKVGPPGTSGPRCTKWPSGGSKVATCRKTSKRGWTRCVARRPAGSPQAQFYLGNVYEKGTGVEREPDRAMGYFRFCAAQGVPECQYRLAHLLLTLS